MRVKDPTTGQWVRQSLRERFEERVDRSEGPDACWRWTGAIEASGYGRLTDYWKKHSAHRLAYVFEHGEVPEGKNVCHSCDNRWCVNPAHLWAGTQRENVADMMAKGRANRPGPINPLRGEAAPVAKLTAADVLAIRAAYTNRRSAGAKTHRGDAPCSIRGLAEQYGVSTGAIHAIIQRRTWTHL